MKVIDLLNKIANGETPPKKIKYCNTICYYNEDMQDYFVDGDMSLCSDFIRFALSDLNTNIEILEDNYIEKLDEEIANISSDKEIIRKINQLIEVINGLNRS